MLGARCYGDGSTACPSRFVCKVWAMGSDEASVRFAYLLLPPKR